MALTDGVNSVMNGTNQAPSHQIAAAPSSGGFGGLGGIGSMIGSSVNGFLDNPFGDSHQGRKSGDEQREFNKSAYPELNPWELAGASNTGMGTTTAQTSNQAAMQSKQIRSNEKIAAINASTQLQGQETQAATSRAVADINAGASERNAGVASSTAIHNVDSQIAAQRHKVSSEVERIKNEISLSHGAKSPLGSVVSDIKSSAHDVARPVRDAWDKITDTTSGNQSTGMKDLMRLKNNLQAKLSNLLGMSDTQSSSKGASGFDARQVHTDDDNPKLQAFLRSK